MSQITGRLKKLRAKNLPHPTWEDLDVTLTISDEMVQDVLKQGHLKANLLVGSEAEVTIRIEGEVRRAFDTYLKSFAMPELKGKSFRCPLCGKPLLTGLFGTVRFGMFHGEGVCGTCGYPCRVIHYPEVPYTDEFSFSFVLPYHPDALRDTSGGVG